MGRSPETAHGPGLAGMKEAPARPAETPPRSPELDRSCVDVVAGVISDVRGRILLARRTDGRDLAGLWEFPGGKREPGETPESALARELHEELGIDVEVGAPLISVPQQYPHKRLRLDVRSIASWRGIPKGNEGQALAWVPPRQLASYPMPPADRPVVAALLQPDRYLVTPEPRDNEVDAWLHALQHALDAGIRRVQLRGAPAVEPARWRALVVGAIQRCRIAGADVLLNSDLALAQELGVGIHLRSQQLDDLHGRPLPPEVTVGASCHDAAELQRAQDIGCDFAVLGPVRATPTHPGAPGLGWDAFARLRELVSLPIYAIGGMSDADITVARTQGGQGIAAIRALWPDDRPGARRVPPLVG